MSHKHEFVSRTLIPAVLAIAAVVFVFILQGNRGLNLWDEGFLWYGAQRVMLGEVPIRDFMAYDPGRYYWSAAIMGLLNSNGIVALRIAGAGFQLMGLFFGLKIVADSSKKQSLLFLFFSTLILIVWMYPRHKLFDVTSCIMMIGALSYLIQHPVGYRYFTAGVVVGIAAVIGRNHGVYGGVASLGIIAWIHMRRTEGGASLFKGLLTWSGGVVVGFSPVLFMAAFVHEFAPAYWRSICFLFELKTTNLALSVPWPWLIASDGLSAGDFLREVLVGIFFVSLLCFSLASVGWVIWQKARKKNVQPAFAAAAFLSLPYTHYAFSRADVGHLALGIFPFLIGCLVLLGAMPSKRKWFLTLLLCGASLWVIHIYHPGWKCGLGRKTVKIEESGSDLYVSPSTANDIELLRELNGKYALKDTVFLATPYWPGSYPLFDKKSPAWEIYALFPRSQIFQQAEIHRIQRAAPGFVFVLDLSLDGRDELRYKNTHPVIYQYIVDNYRRLSEFEHPVYQVFVRKENE